MRSNFYSRIFGLAGLLAWLFATPQLVQAQGPAVNILVANGGVFGPSNMVTVGAWELATSNYALFDSFPASSVQHMITDSGYAYLAADSFLVRYDVAAKQRTNMAGVSGVRKIATYKNHILVTRGFGASSDYVQAYNADDLSLAYSVSGISGQCEGIAVVGDTAYVAVPGSFSDTTGSLAVIDLTSGTLVREIELGTNGNGIGRIYAYDGAIWTINSLAFGSTTGVFTKYEINTQVVTHNPVNKSIGGGAGVLGGRLYLTINDTLGIYDLGIGLFSNAVLIPGGPAVAILDTVNEDIFLTRTDYFSFGRLYHHNPVGVLIDSIDVGISPEAIAIDNYVVTKVNPARNDAPVVRTWPNPVQDLLYVDASEFRKGNLQVSIHDLMGRKLYLQDQATSQFDLDLSFLSPGTYLLRVEGKEGITTKKIIVNGIQ